MSKLILYINRVHKNIKAILSLLQYINYSVLKIKDHFDTIFVDEVDAFPLSMDRNYNKRLSLPQKVSILIFI